MDKFISNLTDIPVDPSSEGNKEDLLHIERYVKALAQYISNASTPTTLAIQGEWGSGKTSLMNQLREELCDNEKSSTKSTEMIEDKTAQKQKAFYSVWLNMWKYSLMQTDPNRVMMTIIQGMTQEVRKIIENKYPDDKNLKNFLKNGIAKYGDKMLLAGYALANVAASYGGLGTIFTALNPREKTEHRLVTTPDTIQQELENTIKKCLEKDKKNGENKKGVIFFIDDLDRIDPTLAVNILEMLKNIFESQNCIFILAIDYDVVVKGLVSKFGKLDSSNERAFRSFFDKIIQLPFTMPISAYEVDEYISKALEQIHYYNYEELNEIIDSDKSVLEYVSDFIENSTGANPRAMKRLFNSLSLIRILQEIPVQKGANSNLSIKDKLINFALVCLQIAYPSIYSCIQKYPVFPEWNEENAKVLHLPQITDSDNIELNGIDELWKRILFRICKVNSYMSNRFTNACALLDTIKELMSCDSVDEFEEKLNELMGISAITNVSQEQKTEKKRERIKADDFYSNLKKIGAPDWGISFVKNLIDSTIAACDNNLIFSANEGSTLPTLSIKNGGKQRGRTVTFQRVTSNGFYLTWPPTGSRSISLPFSNKPSSEALEEIKKNYIEIARRVYKYRQSEFDYAEEIRVNKNEYINKEDDFIFIGDGKRGKEDTFRIKDIDKIVLQSSYYIENGFTEIQKEDSRFIYCNMYYSFGIDCLIIGYGLELNSPIYRNTPEQLSLIYESALANKGKGKREYYTVVKEIPLPEKFNKNEGNYDKEYVLSKIKEGIESLKNRIFNDIQHGVKKSYLEIDEESS
ncbi:KAP family P-loop NTPase fold protein [Succinivibrio dextrinosolvens]|uniref:KAP family P-loop NTPase fold protein n=1 Tax=Succinivibrio dextrinosolvens TaxID=83771 RepID=UPI002479AE2F|nr:P-loop NTPase fold protein [Succinivibrio dextrinosolvens]